MEGGRWEGWGGGSETDSDEILPRRLLNEHDTAQGPATMDC